MNGLPPSMAGLDGHGSVQAAWIGAALHADVAFAPGGTMVSCHAEGDRELGGCDCQGCYNRGWSRAPDIRCIVKANLEGKSGEDANRVDLFSSAFGEGGSHRARYIYPVCLNAVMGILNM